MDWNPKTCCGFEIGLDIAAIFHLCFLKRSVLAEFVLNEIKHGKVKQRHHKQYFKQGHFDAAKATNSGNNLRVEIHYHRSRNEDTIQAAEHPVLERSTRIVTLFAIFCTLHHQISPTISSKGDQSGACDGTSP